MLTSSSQERKQGPFTPLSAAAQGLRDRGVSIYVIGIGDKVKVPELMDLTSDYRNVFVAGDFSALRSRGKVVTDIIKNETKAVSRGKLHQKSILRMFRNPRFLFEIHFYSAATFVDFCRNFRIFITHFSLNFVVGNIPIAMRSSSTYDMSTPVAMRSHSQNNIYFSDMS